MIICKQYYMLWKKGKSRSDMPNSDGGGGGEN